MRNPIYVRPVTGAERERLAAGLRSSEAFVLRRCPIVLASARRETAPAIARSPGCDEQTALNAIHAFDSRGSAALGRRPTHPYPSPFAPDAGSCERLREMLHRSPRVFGKPTSLWTLASAAEVASALGLTAVRVSGEAIRATLSRMGIGWRRAKKWITSPDPEYARKKGRATA